MFSFFFIVALHEAPRRNVGDHRTQGRLQRHRLKTHLYYKSSTERCPTRPYYFIKSPLPHMIMYNATASESNRRGVCIRFVVVQTLWAHKVCRVLRGNIVQLEVVMGYLHAHYFSEERERERVQFSLLPL